MARALVCFLLLTLCSLSAAGPVYVVLWFDTEDYIEPAADDAALRIAKDLTAEGVQSDLQSRRREGPRPAEPRPARRHRGAFPPRHRISLELAQRPSHARRVPRQARLPRRSGGVRAPRGAGCRRRETDLRNPAGVLRAAGKLLGTAKQPRRCANSESRCTWTRGIRSASTSSHSGTAGCCTSSAWARISSARS